MIAEKGAETEAVDPHKVLRVAQLLVAHPETINAVPQPIFKAVLKDF